MIDVPKRNPVVDPDFHQYSLFQFTETNFSSDNSVLIHCSDSAHSIEFISRQQKVRAKQHSPIRKFNVDLLRVQLACRSKVVCIDDVFLLSACQCAQIYPILYEAQSTIKILL